MSMPFDDMSTLDRLVHEPSRLTILTALSACRYCDFVFMQSVTHISKGNLSNHLQKLEDGGLVEIEKGYKGRVPRTTVRITPKGRSALDRHWRRLEELRNAGKEWQPLPTTQQD
jgi:DNA-binding MarR family transcriptional regulator